MNTQKHKWFAGKVALVTGATSGIGRQIARLLISYGCRLLPCGRDRQAMELLLQEAKDGGLTCPQYFLVDFSDIKAVECLVRDIKKEHKPDILVNNAGFGYIDNFYSMPHDLIDAMLEVNVKSTVYLCRKFIPQMIRQKGSGILNVGSGASFFATPGSGLYGATKHFILGFTEALHQELLSFGVHVTGVYPGHTASRFAERATAGKLKQWHKPMSAEAVARAALSGLEKNKIRVIPGLENKIKVSAGRILPTRFILNKVHKSATKHKNND